MGSLSWVGKNCCVCDIFFSSIVQPKMLENFSRHLLQHFLWEMSKKTAIFCGEKDWTSTFWACLFFLWMGLNTIQTFIVKSHEHRKIHLVSVYRWWSVLATSLTLEAKWKKQRGRKPKVRIIFSICLLFHNLPFLCQTFERGKITVLLDSLGSWIVLVWTAVLFQVGVFRCAVRLCSWWAAASHTLFDSLANICVSPALGM